MIGDVQKNEIIHRLEEIFCTVIEIEYTDDIKKELFDESLEINIDSLSFIRFLVAIEEEYYMEFTEEIFITEHKSINALLKSLADELIKMENKR